MDRTHSPLLSHRTCHWGFDSANWRSYLHLWDGYGQNGDRDRLERRFADFKNRFSVNAAAKRKVSIDRIRRANTQRIDIFLSI